MGYIILAIIIFMVFRKNSINKAEKQTAAVRNGDKDEYINRLYIAFSRVRDYHEVFDTGISVCDYCIAVNGQPTGELAKFLSIRVDNDDGHAAGLAERLGMRIICQDGKYIYELPVKGVLSKAEKKAVLERLASKISNNYPNDHLKISDTILYDFVEMQHIIDVLQRK